MAAALGGLAACGAPAAGAPPLALPFPDAGAASLSVAFFAPPPGAVISLGDGGIVRVQAVVQAVGSPFTVATLALDDAGVIGAPSFSDAGPEPSWLVPFSADGDHELTVTVWNQGGQSATASRAISVGP